ncbi:MAG: hypothetical protein ABIK31_06615 [candidate division WOR-3 bacterium]
MKINNLFFILLSVIIPYYFTEACDPPYTQHFFTDIYFPQYGEECFVTIVYCCWWDSQNLRLNWFVKEIRQRSWCMVDVRDEIAWRNFKNFVYQKVARHAILNCAPPLPSCEPPPPINVNRYFARCYKYHNFWSDKYWGSEEWLISLKSCLDRPGKCEHRLIVCVDYSLYPPDIVVLLDECEVIQEPDCSYNVPEIPPEGKSWDEEWETECFAKPCCP